MSVRGAVLSGAVVLVALTCCNAEDRPVYYVGGGIDAGSPSPSQGDAAAIAPPPDAPPPLPVQPSRGSCVATECPPGYGSCPDFGGAPPRDACASELLSDPFNCGACGFSCPPGEHVGLDTSCVNGQCLTACKTGFADCNGIVDDGCEVSLPGNPEHCGACGNACAAGEPCLEDGTCGCPTGATLCDGVCVFLDVDDNHCGSCNTPCNAEAPGDAGTPPPNARLGCGGGVCSTWKCDRTFGQWEDCNGDLASGPSSDGCEVQVDATEDFVFFDADHCGSCTTACAAGQSCFRNDFAQLVCGCSTGETLCPGPVCADLENDPNHCGACGSACPSAPNAEATCERGRCGLTCQTGFDNCNGTWTDGCESDPVHDASNCGGCGNACDMGAGQPCFNGQCLMRECEVE